jgi:catechol 2,3-dioxygenase-like lactoylglutathione lyase family enzyme
MPARGIQHIDLTVGDVERYLSFGDESMGLRPADGGEHRYYEVGLEHFADIAGYYAFFVFDPDGIRVEVFSHQR